ncbi:unnamed protein product, partial [Brugia pahangi]|uniref:Ovule protein n=1 Tax=Brugia pahangi TaxID=6280 RepID=A0A0N4TGK8_BRUPA
RVWQDGYGGRNRKSSIFNLGSDSNSDSDVGAPGIGSVGLSGSVLHDMQDNKEGGEIEMEFWFRIMAIKSNEERSVDGYEQKW